MKKLTMIFCAAGLSLSSCAYVPVAREAKKKPREAGVISLNVNHRPEDQEKAAQLMAANCGGANVKVLEEGEVIVGERSSSSGSKHREEVGSGGLGLGGGFTLGGTNRPGERVNATTETTQLKEWQISYICETPSSRRK